MPVKTSYAPGEPIWVDLSTPDVPATIAFYGALFGWECDTSRAEEFGGYANFHVGGKKVAGVMPLMAPGMPPVWSSYVCTDDADKTAALVEQAGGTVVGPPMDVQELGRMAVFTAPTGEFFGVWQPREHLGAELVEEEGVFSWAELTTRDHDAALGFYEQVFGWSAKVQDGYTEFQRSGQSVAGCFRMNEQMPAEVPNYWMPYFQAEDPAAKAEQAVSLGATMVVPFQDMGNVAFTVVSDPHGSTFGLLRTGP